MTALTQAQHAVLAAAKALANETGRMQIGDDLAYVVPFQEFERLCDALDDLESVEAEDKRDLS